MATTAAPVAKRPRASRERSPGDRPPGEPRARRLPVPAAGVRGVRRLRPVPLYARGVDLAVGLGRADGRRPGRGSSNYAEVFTDEELRSAFVHALILLLFYAVLPIADRAGAGGRDGAGAGARARVLPDDPVPAAGDRDGRRRGHVEDDLRPATNGALNRFLGWFGIEGKSWLGDFDAGAAVGRVGRARRCTSGWRWCCSPRACRRSRRRCMTRRGWTAPGRSASSWR